MKRDLEFISKTIKKYIDTSRYRVFIFGSRADGTAGKYSDYDIGIEGDKLPAKLYCDLQSEFEESDFPYKVEIVEFRDVSDKFKEVAKKHIIEIK